MSTCCCWEPVKSCDRGPDGAEWYAGFSTLKPLLQDNLQYTDSILVYVGPQASCLHEDLYDSGYRGITAVHSSQEVVQLMRQRQTAGNRPILSCQAADIAEGLAFDHCPYNAIIDKGALDAILCQESGVQDAEAAMQVVWNNLKGPGTYVLFTHGPPSIRMAMLSKLQWASVTIKALVPVGTALAAPAQQRSKTTDGLEIVDAAAEAEFAGSMTYVYICNKPYQYEYARVHNTLGMLVLEASRLPPVDPAITSQQCAGASSWHKMLRQLLDAVTRPRAYII